MMYDEQNQIKQLDDKTISLIAAGKLLKVLPQ